MTADLIYWARERERIRKAKATGKPPPWTSDKILQTYRFCNLRRSDDRVSQWLINNVLRDDLWEKYGNRSFIAFAALCRWINWPPTIKAIIASGAWHRDIDWDRAIRVIEQLSAAGAKVWTGAYMIRAEPGDKGTKAFHIVNRVVRPIEAIADEIFLDSHDGREAVNELVMTRYSWGSFMSGQLVADLGYMSLLAGAEDTYTWAPRGPGSERGFNRLLDRNIKEKITDAEWTKYLVQWRGELITSLGTEYEDLTAHDVQNALCEVDKYLRVCYGEGRPRSKYTPETAF